MTIPIGNFIKLKRMELNLSQEQLCEGICAPSYLSRIENNKLIPDDEIYRLLLKRLGLDYEDLIWETDFIAEEIENWYRELLEPEYTELKRDVEELKRRADLIGGETAFKFRAVYCRYLLNNGQIEEATNHLKQLGQVIPQEASRAFFIYTNVLMFNLMLQGNYEEAIQAGRELLKVKGFDQLGNEEEVGIFFYNLALSYSNLSRFKMAEEYAKQALTLFNNGYCLERALSTLLLRGICLNNIQEWNEAMRVYDRAEKILRYLPEETHSHNRGKLNNNRGSCMLAQGKYEEALAYYQAALKDIQGQERIIPLLNLIYCCYEAGKHEEAKHWMTEVERAGNGPVQEIYQRQLEVFFVLLSEKKPQIRDVERVQIKCLEYFLENRHLQLAVHYCKLFIRVYERNHHYKKANEMYRIIRLAETEMRKGG
ncbi:helix-turn-helix domain-containing protein [Caldibacillus debilis]|uniref:Tetratricopeptide repeat/Helix-turn-helix domain n=1 Tax=Caldibacillus debilis GB1 TaxID=1339248 RepID=A0A420VDP5_9BACI|nr:helix-turn-helix domain-containing protein [Caldibacillus debilis]RKO61781.1 Tetratricopeptide repeat/Helix-turn-helix domain [Caldibacillus debilis GB1]